MGLIKRATKTVTGEHSREPVGTVHIVDPSPLNWLYVLYNSAEELVRVNPTGYAEPAAMNGYRRADERTLESTYAQVIVSPMASRLQAPR